MDEVKDENSFPFTITDNYILDSEKLEAFEQIIYIHLKKHTANNYQSFPSVKLLAKKLHISENTVRKNLKSLETKGFITITQRFNDSNEYTLVPLQNIRTNITKQISKVQSIGIAAVLKFYQSNINPTFGTMERDSLISWLEKFEDNSELIIKAIGIAVTENVRKLKYIEAILIDWDKNGIKTVEQAESYTKLRAQKRNPVKTEKVDAFNNYEQRTYDYGDLEKKLLGYDS